MKKTKLSLSLIFLLVLPAASLELLNTVYNSYVPIFLQAGNPAFATKTLTYGFGLGALLVGFWMVADNLLGFIILPLVGAWSDRTHSKRGRRLPFILGTLPLIIVGYSMIPMAPQLIPAGLNGQRGQLIGLFIFFTISCIVYYMGYTPIRAIYQTLRQESVSEDNRPKVESWYWFLTNVLGILALTLGGFLYRIYGPMIFWVGLVFYIICTIVLAIRFKEPEQFAGAASQQEQGTLKQLQAIFKGASRSSARNLAFFLGSVALFSLTLSALTNFGSSWVVNVVGVNETKAASTVAMVAIATTIVVLPVGYLAGGKFGRRNMYLVGLTVTLLAALTLAFAPNLYILAFILVGVGTGAGLTSQLPLVSELAYDQKSLGSVIGVYNTFYALGFMLGSFLMGWIIQSTGYLSMGMTLVIFMVLAILCAAFVRPEKKAMPVAVSSQG